MIDLNVMSRDPVVEEWWREHHVVAREPELGVILPVELHNVSSSEESEAWQDAESAETPDIDAGVV